MAGRSDGAVGVFVAGLALCMWGVIAGFVVLLLILGGLFMLGAVAATARQRRTGPAPEVTLRPGSGDRPWKRGQQDGSQ